MYRKTSIQIYLWTAALCFFAPGSSLGQGQPSPVSQTAVSGHNSADAFDVKYEQWKKMTTAELLKAAESGNAQAQYFYWKRKSAEANDDVNRASGEMWAIADMLTGEQKKSAEAQWKSAPEAALEQAAKAGDKGAQMVAAQRKVEQAVQREVEAFGWLEKSAEQGFPVAEYEAAMLHLRLSGWVIGDIDQPKGIELLRRSADHGWAAAQYQLGKIYLAGELLPPSLPEAIKYFQEAADQGGPASQYELAQLYANGIGEPRGAEDLPIALLHKSAKTGYYPALHALAECYRTGLGASIDYIQSIRYYQAARKIEENTAPISKACDADIFKLVDENLEPKAVVDADLVNFAKVMSVYLRATERNDPAAMSQIGEWYFSGRFVPKDSVPACYWYSLAADHGAAGAAGKRDEIKATLNPEQMRQLQKSFHAL
jgi:TPR repeat protein